MPDMDGLDDWITGHNGDDAERPWGNCPKCGWTQEDAYIIEGEHEESYQCPKCATVYSDLAADEWGKP